MKVSERLHLLRAVSEVLGGEEWAVVDITLRQFGLPTTDRWSDSRTAYVMQMTENAEPAVLRALAKHVGIVDENDSQDASAPSCWVENHFRLFISHVSAKKEVASKLALALREYRICAFVAHEDIEPTREWQDEIQRALKTANALVPIMTPGFHESDWTDQEVGIAIGRSILVVPMKFGLDPYGFIGRYQAVSMAGKSYPTLASELFDIFAKHSKSTTAMAEAVVGHFESGHSWESTRENMTLLERFPTLGDEHLARISRALEQTEKIRDTWGVPVRGERLLRTHKRAG